MTYTVINEASGDAPGTVSVKTSHYIPEQDSTLTIPNEVTNSADGKQYIVTEIDEYGFIELDSYYSKVVLPNNLVKIGQYAFSGRNTNTDGSIKGTSIESIVFNNGLEKINSNAFDGCKNLTTIDIPASVTSLGQNVFRNCTSLNKVNLTEGITFIGKGTFDGCEKLTTLSVPNSLTDTFSGNCWNTFHSGSFLEKIIIKEDNDNYTSIDGIVYTKDKTKLVYCPPAKTNANVEDGVKQIGLTRGQVQSVSLGFYGCRELINVTLPNSLERIEEDAFYMCQKLEKVRIPDSVTYIGPDAFYTCKSLTDITFPAKLDSIGNGAFLQCSLLNNIHLPYGLKTIGNYAFKGCAALERIEIPATVNTIGEGTFKECAKLLGVDLPDGLNTIESEMFSKCTSLRTFVVPNGVTTINKNAFSGCSSLVSIEFPTTITSVSSLAFGGDGLATHRFFNKESTGNSDYYEPGDEQKGDVEKIQGRVYIGTYVSSEFTFYEYTGTETDARYNIRYYTNEGYNDFANPPDMTREDEVTLAEPTRKGHTFNG